MFILISMPLKGEWVPEEGCAISVHIMSRRSVSLSLYSLHQQRLEFHRIHHVPSCPRKVRSTPSPRLRLSQIQPRLITR